MAKPAIVNISPKAAEGLSGGPIGKMMSKLGSPVTMRVTSSPPINMFMPKIIIKKAKISL